MATVLTRKYLGIEIGPEAISAVLVQSQRGADRILAWHRVPGGADTALGDLLARALEPIMKRDDLTGVGAVVSLPAGQFLFRRLAAPFKEDRKVRQVLPFELEPSLPLPVDELVFDFRRLEDDANATLLTAALERERVADLLGELASLRIDPERLTVGGLDAVLQMGRLPEPAASCLVLDLTGHGATLFLLSQGEIQEIRSVPLTAETTGGQRRLVERLRQTCLALQNADGSSFAPEQVLLTGYDARHEALADELTRELDLPVARVDLAHALALDTGPGDANGWSPGAMNNALALALAGRERDTGLNLRQGPFAVKDFWSRHRRALQRTGLLALAVLAMAVGQVGLSMHLKAREAERLGREIASVFRESFPEVTRVVDPLHQMKIKIKELRETALLPGLTADRPRAIDLLTFISRSLPVRMDVELTRLVMGPESITIAGHTAGFNTVDEIKKRLEQGDVLSDVTISAANIDKQSGRVRFNLTAAPREAP